MKGIGRRLPLVVLIVSVVPRSRGWNKDVQSLVILRTETVRTSRFDGAKTDGCCFLETLTVSTRHGMLFVLDLVVNPGPCSKVFLTAMMDRLEEDSKKGMGQFTQEEGRVSAYHCRCLHVLWSFCCSSSASGGGTTVVRGSVRGTGTVRVRACRYASVWSTFFLYFVSCFCFEHCHGKRL